MPDRVFNLRHPRIRFALDVIVVLLLLVAVYQQSQNRDLADQIRRTQMTFIKEQARVNVKFAVVLTKGCITANSSKESLRNLLIAVETAQASDPHVTAQERKDGKKFFDAQIKNIHLTDCSKYKRVVN